MMKKQSNYYKLFSIAIIFSLFLSSCSEAPDYENNPAKEQIAEYTARLKKCETEKEQLKQEKDVLSKAVEQKALNQVAQQNDITENPATPLASQQVVDNKVQEQNIVSKEEVPQETTAQAQTTSTNNTNVQTINPSPSQSILAKTNRSLMKASDDDMVIGANRNAKVVFIEYFSPTCPHCAYYEKDILPKIKEKYVDTNKITYVIREFISNKQDLDASLLARCSGDVDSFMKFVSVLLAQQTSWAVNNNYRAMLTNIGQLGGVSAESYAKCLNDEKLTQILIDNTKLVSATSHFIGTPAFFINNVQFTDGYTFEAISKAIDKALEKEVLEKTN